MEKHNDWKITQTPIDSRWKVDYLSSYPTHTAILAFGIYQLKCFSLRRKATFSFISSLLSLLWKSSVGDLEKSEEWKENSEKYKNKKPLARLFILGCGSRISSWVSEISSEKGGFNTKNGRSKLECAFF